MIQFCREDTQILFYRGRIVAQINIIYISRKFIILYVMGLYNKLVHISVIGKLINIQLLKYNKF